MKLLYYFLILGLLFSFNFCKDNQEEKVGLGISSVEDNSSQKNILNIAVGSKDHTTLVKAVQATELEDTLASPGPFTVFAPINGAFDKLPSGSIETLLKPEKKDSLEDILFHHVIVGVFKSEDFQDGQDQTMFDGGKVHITKKDGKVMIDNATILVSIPATNGIIHVVDSVILPKK